MTVVNPKTSVVKTPAPAVKSPVTSSATLLADATTTNAFTSATDSLQLSSDALLVADCDCDCPPLAPEQDAALWGDPHIEDADGGKYTVSPVGNLNLLTDKNVTLIGKMEGKAGKVSVMTEAGLTVRDKTVHITADGSVVIGSADPNNTDTTELKDGDTMMLDDYNVIKREGNNVTVTTPEYRLGFSTNNKVKIKKAGLNGKNSMRVDIHSKEDGVAKDGQAPTGLLGETFDADKKKQSKPKQAMSTYKTDSLFPGVAAPAADAVAQDASSAKTTTGPDGEVCDCPPEADNEHGRMWGDPHLEGADGEKYDVQEKGITNILSDHGIEMNANTVGQKNGPGWHTEVGLTLRDNTVNVKADGTVTIGHKDGSSTTLADGQTIMLDDYNAIKKEGSKVTLLSQEYKLQLSTQQKSKMKNAPKGLQFINTDLWSKDMGVKSDGTAPSGLLGETFDADNVKQKKPKFDISTYKRDALIPGGSTVQADSDTPAAPATAKAPAAPATAKAPVAPASAKAPAAPAKPVAQAQSSPFLQGLRALSQAFQAFLAKYGL